MTRLRRKEFLIYGVIIFVISFVIVQFLDGRSSQQQLLFLIGVGIILLAIQLRLAARRLNDINFSGWYSLLLLIPIVNFAGILLYFIDGTKGSNKYGADPKNRILVKKTSIKTKEKREEDYQSKIQLLETSKDSGLLSQHEFDNMFNNLKSKKDQEIKKENDRTSNNEKKANLLSLWKSKLISQEEYLGKLAQLESEQINNKNKMNGYSLETRILIIQDKKEFGPMSVQQALLEIKEGRIKPAAFIKKVSATSFNYRAIDLLNNFSDL